MERRSNYPIEIKAKIDLNTDLLLTELQQLLGKDRSKLLRLYLQLIIPQYFISNKSGIWSLSLIVHSKG